MRIQPVAVATMLIMGVTSFFHSHVSAWEKPTNVLFIMIDDFRPELASYKVDGIQTPHIDRLAAKGLAIQRSLLSVPCLQRKPLRRF